MSSDPDVMTDSGENQEPTMEEILASIRRIISEDGDGAAEAQEAAAEEAADATADETPEPVVEEEPEPEPEPEVQAEFADEEPEPEPEPEPQPEPADSGILELTEVAEAADAEFGKAEAIASNEASSNAGQSFDHLSALMVSGYDGADNTLQGLVRDMLKPMLDENLPRIVHELVDREVARISRRR